jgi:hypothetical protein
MGSGGGGGMSGGGGAMPLASTDTNGTWNAGGGGSVVTLLDRLVCGKRLEANSVSLEDGGMMGGGSEVVCRGLVVTYNQWRQNEWYGYGFVVFRSEEVVSRPLWMSRQFPGCITGASFGDLLLSGVQSQLASSITAPSDKILMNLPITAWNRPETFSEQSIQVLVRGE